jgi:hypothetical protein
MHLVGFIIRIFHDARSFECQNDGFSNCYKENSESVIAINMSLSSFLHQ